MSVRTQLPSGLVTFAFTDIEGSTRLAQLLGPRYQPVLNQHREILRRAFGAGGGVELFTEGDSFFFAFGDATAALGACLEAQRALERHAWPDPAARPRVRMGLHSGVARPQDGEYASPEVHRAARVAAAAHGGQVLCSAATARHAGASAGDAWLRDLGLFRLRGFEGRDRLFQLVAPGLEERFPRPRTAEAAPHNLPAPTTSFVGRQPEQLRLTDLVAGNRLVTVVGAGGAGKTRLAVQVAQTHVEAFPDGVWFVDLAPVTDPGLVAVTVAGTMGLRPEPGRPVLETLAEHIADRRLLLVLDTCDTQVAAVATMAAQLLAAGGAAAVLATSREPLGLPGEVVWRIPPLSLQPPAGGGLSDAVALLAERARAARGDSGVQSEDLPHLARIAAQLSGLPLGLELAAARLRVLPASQLAERLDTELQQGPAEMLSTLDAGRSGAPTAATSRHTTLQAAVGWSYRTLEPTPARLLRALSVFGGPVELATAEWLLGEDPLDALTVLVDKSLVSVETDVPTGGQSSRPYRYRMLDPIRAFAARALAVAGEEDAARDRHVAWLLEALDRVRVGPDGRAVTLSLDRLDVLADEVRTALRWCATAGSGRAGLQLARSLDQWWRERGLAREARLWLFRLYGRVAETGEEVPDAELATAYHVHSLQADADGEYAEQLRFSERAEAAARRSGDFGLLVRVLAGRGVVLRDLGYPVEAEQICRDVIAWAAEHDATADAVFAVYFLAQSLWQRGEPDAAAEVLSGARQAESARPEIRGRRTVDMLLGAVALARGDLVAAHDHLVVALRSRMKYGFHSRACDTVGAMAARCALGGDHTTAARLFGAVQSARLQLQRHPGSYGEFLNDHEVAVRTALGGDRFDKLYAEGAALSLTEAAAVALSVRQEARADLPNQASAA